MVIDFKIEKEKISAPIIDKNGNIDYSYCIEKDVLKTLQGDVVSHKYLQIIHLFDDHFAVLGIPTKHKQCFYNNDYNADYEIYSKKLKWGIIRINRDSEGKIIPKQETMVFPFIYNSICNSNLKTVFASEISIDKFKHTYLDLDVESNSYGHQLVPCILEFAYTYDFDFKTRDNRMAFAICKIDDKTRFIPRNIIARTKITADDLLTEEEVVFLKYDEPLAKTILNGKYDVNEQQIGKTALEKYFNLTGEKIDYNKDTQRKKVF